MCGEVDTHAGTKPKDGLQHPSLVAASDVVAKIANHKIVPRGAEKLPSHNFPSSLHIVGT
jgi:hypothetical protein